MREEPMARSNVVLKQIDKAEKLLREALAIADIVAECNAGTLDDATVTVLGDMLRRHLRELTEVLKTLHSNLTADPAE